MYLAHLPPVILLLCWLLRGAASEEDPLVRVEKGDLRGRRVERSARSPLRTLYAFEGIPFARPPVGDLRFKDPQDAVSWPGILNVTAYGPSCIQKQRRTGIVSGQEDCLYLNVYTSDPPEKWANVQRPVIVYIHGGAFIMWSGNLEHIRVDPILREGIVFVTTNYRLGVMGFLNTEDSQAPGNAGLKDQNMALRWVQRNIAAFGGDPTNVTIMGESAGGASVHYHVLSPLSRGLFQRAISVSGSALPTWARVQRPRARAMALRRRFASACPQMAEDAIVRCLQQIDAHELVFNQHDVPLQPYQDYFLKNTFLPSVEATSTGSAPFLTAEPEQLMREGNFTRVPYMTGFTSSDGIIILRFANLISNSSAWAEVDEHFEEIFRWELPPGHRTLEEARQLRQFYLGDRSLRDAPQNNDTQHKFAQLCTDTFFAAGTVTSARLLAKHGAPVYVYQFSRDGPIAYLKDLYNASHIAGVMHGDDMAYVFDFIIRATGDPRPVPSSEQRLRERQVKIFANFAKTGSPTPEGSNLLQWPLFTSGNESYMDMDEELAVVGHVLGERANFWRELFNGNPSVGNLTTHTETRKS